jgi:hypothetical protein
MAEADKDNVSQNSVKHSSVKASKSRPQNANLQPFDSVTAKQAQLVSARARSLRKQMQAKLLDTAINEGLDKYFAKAIKNMDADAIEVVSKAAKLVGLDFASSEESVQKMEVKSDSKLTTSGPINITFTDPKPKKES